MRHISAWPRTAVLIFCVATSFSILADEKRDVPSDQQQATAKKLIAELYQDDYRNAKYPQERIAIAEKMVRVGDDTRDDAASQFMLWRIARDVATNAGDYDLAQQAIDKLAANFKIDAAAMKLQTIHGILAAKQAVPDYQKLLPATNVLFDELVESERMDLADETGQLLTEFSRKIGDPACIQQTEERIKRLQTIKAAFAEAGGAIAALKSDPTDSAANTTVGRMRCFVLEDWTKGLPLLAQCNNAALETNVIDRFIQTGRNG